MPSVSFIPSVRPTWWLTKTAVRPPLWLAWSHVLSLVARVCRVVRQLIILLAYCLGPYNTLTNWKWFLAKSVARIFTLSLFWVFHPLLGFTSFRFRIFRFLSFLLESFALMSYYAFLLMSSELVTYLKVDWVLKVVGVPCVHWAARGMRSVLAWKDVRV